MILNLLRVRTQSRTVLGNHCRHLTVTSIHFGCGAVANETRTPTAQVHPIIVILIGIRIHLNFQKIIARYLIVHRIHSIIHFHSRIFQYHSINSGRNTNVYKVIMMLLVVIITKLSSALY